MPELPANTPSDRPPGVLRLGGLLYVNPADPALAVERRRGVGYTLNFGNPRAWVVLGVILMLPLTFLVVLGVALLVSPR